MVYTVHRTCRRFKTRLPLKGNAGRGAEATLYPNRQRQESANKLLWY